MADALASGASVRKDVGVQVPPRAPHNIQKSLANSFQNNRQAQVATALAEVTSLHQFVRVHNYERDFQEDLF